VTAINAFAGHACALTNAGGVKCWGDLELGQAGERDDHPVQLEARRLRARGRAVTAIAAGGTHICALTSAGGVKCWGDNEDGQRDRASAASPNRGRAWALLEPGAPRTDRSPLDLGGQTELTSRERGIMRRAGWPRPPQCIARSAGSNPTCRPMRPAWSRTRSRRPPLAAA
jgi:hypothetical protein